MTAKLCATTRVNVRTNTVTPADNTLYTKVTLPDKFIGCDYIETVSCRNATSGQSDSVVFANAYCYTDCMSTMLIATYNTLYQIAMKLSADGSVFMYKDRYEYTIDQYVMILGYKFQ